MPYRCVVGGFSRVSTDGVWLYFWPRDEAQAKLWDRFVRSYRLERTALDLLLISSKGNCSTTAPHRRSIEERTRRGNTKCSDARPDSNENDNGTPPPFPPPPPPPPPPLPPPPPPPLHQENQI
ncbi:hypothetical protein CAPTEDRAFT_212114 [Capitella teleta]|uniref:Uncharacterized protein n=1 Tax=Capitella teleta TaxID=283909 RepID=R7THC2_CAPTE|nr:hypothetical protein CAPTEDRAFT_212114 [Capitella teleta]|eukprot:ELT92832.1 hypothetical protein CAPTEDRAFT_212114 [Capitella teleta]